jgi:hypothetical protein
VPLAKRESGCGGVKQSGVTFSRTVPQARIATDDKVIAICSDEARNAAFITEGRQYVDRRPEQVS